MKPPRLPLSSLRTFAVVARLLSVTKAADELKVTPSAVSHHIKLLEEYLETKLLRRTGNKIALTAAGERYVAQVEDGLLLLSNATRNLKAAKDQPILRVACPPSLGMLWLMGRIGGFMKERDDISLSMTMVPDPTILLRSAFDVGLWYGQGPLSGLRVVPLSRNPIFPICSPHLARHAGAIAEPGDLANHTLLDSSDETYYDKQPQRPGWHGWLQAAGLPDIAGKRYLNFTPRVYMHQAVRECLGVGLSRGLLAVDELAEKQIVVPFGPAVEQPSTYNLVCPTVLIKRRDVIAFTEWIVSEAQRSMSILDKLLAEFR
ncbi:MAG TPA: LysR substrate-binding domain-containing protein [Burkholderiales bacterium]|nr:LysR substrate-binding domain-containing protein [Burkholderiales bacterium]